MLRLPLYKLLRLLFLVSLFCLSSCKTDTVKVYKIGFSQCQDDEWRDAMNESMIIQAALHPEIDLTIFQSYLDYRQQISHIEKMIHEKMDLIIVSPLEPDSIVPVIEKAYKMGIPVIIVDRKINSNKYTTYIGADNLEVGGTAAKYIASFNNKYKRVIEIMGADSSSPVLERSAGFHQEVSNEPKIDVVLSMKGLDEDRFNADLDSLKNNPVDFIYAFNDQLAHQAYQIWKGNGTNQNLKFIGVDGLYGPNGGIQFVKDNILTATILYPTGGDEAIPMAVKILNGESIPKEHILNTTVIDDRNVDIMLAQFNKINSQQNDIEIQQERIKQQEETYTTQNNILKLLLALLIISIILGAYSVYSTYKLKRKKRELELRNKKITIQGNQIKKIAKEVKESNEAKTNFFTGVSHEFKTPITLILSSVESMADNFTIKDSKLINEVGLVFNNAKRLLRLINQLLDFRKIEDRKFTLKASETNLFKFSSLIFQDFESEAQKRNIDFFIKSNNEDLNVYIDRDLMDKVYFNLLSNAFKFTPNNGSISINIVDEAKSNFVKIYFKDSGIGIQKGELEKVFRPFFQGSNNSKSSSGIGLHISKEFVELHKGSIEVSSKHGAEFVVTLYKGNAHLNSDEIIFEPDLVDEAILSFNTDYQEDTFIEHNLLNDDEHYSVLIIEDNEDLVRYLEGKLSKDYIVHSSDGTDGIEKALELIPDIIICDISLPGDKNGYEICEILKKDLRTSHIPNIMLTALHGKEAYIKGLESGADLFLTKPFSFAILSQSVKTLLYNREKLRYYYINNVHKIEAGNGFGLYEQDFLNKINSIINDNLDNSNFTVEAIADKLNISRVQLYRKFKAILGVKISDYIQNTRLDKAKELLKTSSLTISEIAYSTGFSSPNYFSTAFKNKFNQSPKAYRETA